jgi:hypothetical protein
VTARESQGRESPFGNPVTRSIALFLQDIGITVRAAELSDPTFLPGIRIDAGDLIVDESKLRYPGDLLHEAGHLAVAEPARRAMITDKIEPTEEQRGGEEMAAIAWSYAAAIHLGLDPGLVFHDAGYRDDSDSLLENFSEGRYIGVPLLQWMGLTVERTQAREADIEPYPAMIAWLRGDDEAQTRRAAKTDGGRS